jgi:hypothetical protein
MEHDAWFILGLFVFIFLIWIATGGPLHPLSFAGPTLSQPDVLGGGTYLSFPRAPFGIGGNTVSLPGSSGDTGVGSSNNTSNPSLPTLVGGTAFGTASLYRGKVTLTHYISGAGSSDPNNEYTELRVSSSAGVPVNISGWTLVSESSGAANTIPLGTETPTSGTVNAAQNIILEPGESALIISGRSPIGASFRENKCIGYFSTFQNFSPPLPQNCPAPTNELSQFYGPDYVRDAACIDYVHKLTRCQVVLSPPTTVSSSCQSFLVNYLNYNGCVNAHQRDSDFLDAQWRVYLGRTTPLWKSQHEIVKLLDTHGDTVDAFSY